MIPPPRCGESSQLVIPDLAGKLDGFRHARADAERSVVEPGGMGGEKATKERSVIGARRKLQKADR